jgi:hypothetical protein
MWWGQRVMTVLSLTAPGRFPTVVHDPGQWWSTLAASGKYRLRRFSANAEWWRVLCSPAVEDVLGGPLPRRAARRVLSRDLKAAATRAGRALEMLRRSDAYESVAEYVQTVSALAEHLHALNRGQTELRFSLESGVRVVELDYDDSRAVVEYARRPTPLSELIERGLKTCPREIELLLVNVTSPEDLLCALIAVHHLRRDRPSMHACLADHGYENFSLTPYLTQLRTAGTLDTIFDSIIESKDERDLIVPILAQAAAAGRAPRGFLRRTDFGDVDRDLELSSRYSPPPPVPVFASEPVFWTRVSPRRCYWSRCAFCVQNNKYDASGKPARAEIPGALDRVAALLDAGYRTVYFSDEALSPTLLDALCRGIADRGLRFRWACRCKLERAYTAQLFRRMRAAGCCEVLFGLESISPRMQRRMDKYVDGLDREAIAAIFQAANTAEIGIHVNLIIGFPGDSPEEAIASVEFLMRALAKVRDATFVLNRFVLFPGTPVINNPAAFGITPLPASGDMVWLHPYRVAPEFEANALILDRMLPALRARLLTGLGWDQWFGNGPGPQAARELYSLSGHGVIFKATPRNPFTNPPFLGPEGGTHDGHEPVLDRRDWLRGPICAR